MQSFLNIIELDTGRQIRVAELGYFAERPSFCGDTVRFERMGRPFRLSLRDGLIRPEEASDFRNFQSDASRKVYLKFNSEPVGGIAYVELILESDGEKRVLARFMGGDGSLGDSPVSSDGGRVVFFGYPSPDGIN